MLLTGLDDKQAAHESGHMLIDVLESNGFRVVRARPLPRMGFPALPVEGLVN